MMKATFQTWLTSPVRGGNRTTSPAVYFRREFTLAEKPVDKAFLHLAALGLADCEINGRRVSDDTLAPDWSDYRFRAYYRTYEVSHLLREGANAIGVTLGNGWYCGHVGAFNRQIYGLHPLFSLELESGREVSPPSHSEGAKSSLPLSPETLVATDEEWRYNDHGPIIENDIYMGESYDARLELGPWSQPAYDDQGWHPALPADTPEIAIQPALSPAVRPQETFHGREVGDFSSPNKVGNVVKIFDFGQNIAGRIRLRVKGPRGLTISLRHGEMLEPNGTLHTANLLAARATDNYTCKGMSMQSMQPTHSMQSKLINSIESIPSTPPRAEGAECEQWEPRFTFHGFRYCEVTWLKHDEASAKTEVSLEAVALHSDLPRTGTLECSHPLLNQLVSNVRWSQKGNFLGLPTDCPQRSERFGYTGDAQVFARTAAFFLDSDAFLRQWLAAVRDAQTLHDGAVPPYAPYIDSWWGLSPDGGPGWGDAIFIVPWTAYLCYGDTAILRENLPAMRAYLVYIEKNSCVHDIRAHTESAHFRGFGDWLAIDRQGHPVETSKALIGAAYHAHAAELTARTAETLGEDATPYWQLHARLLETYRKNFLDENGLPIDQTQTAHALPLRFRLLPEEARQPAGDRLAELVKENDYHMATGFLGTPHLLAALEDTGHLDTAYRLLMQEVYPSWLFPVKNGATTIWERWDAWTPDRGFHPHHMNSFNHYAYGAVAEWMVTTVAGLDLDPAYPAYRHIVFKPRPGGGLTHARAALRTRHGHTAISWALKDNALHLTLDIPEGAYATLTLPPEYKNPAPDRLEPGQHEYVV